MFWASVREVILSVATVAYAFEKGEMSINSARVVLRMWFEEVWEFKLSWQLSR